MHKIAIDETILAQVKTQRPKLNRYDSLVGPKTALVVIDMQNAFMLPGMPVEVPVARDIVPNVNTLAAATRSAGGKVVWVKMCLEGRDRSLAGVLRRRSAARDFDGTHARRPRLRVACRPRRAARGYDNRQTPLQRVHSGLVRHRPATARRRYRHRHHRRHAHQCLLRSRRPAMP